MEDRHQIAVPAMTGQPAHSLAVAEVLQQLATDARGGLPATEVANRQQMYGWNVLATSPPPPLWKKLLNQFRELVIWILIVAAAISGMMGEWADTLAILAIVLVNGIIGFLQEERAGRALAALAKLSAPMAKVIRGGQLQTIPSRELVPGDRVELEAGDNVPADVRLLQSYSLRIQEAALTGESVPVDKEAEKIVSAATPLGDRQNMAYASTVVAAGKAAAVVVATGMNTEVGRIAGLLEHTEPEPTPLQRRLAELGKILVVVCLVIVVIIFILEIARGRPFLEVLLISVSLAVAAVPEGLPAVVTLALAIGLQRMVRRNALVRKLPSVETLGSVTVICSDKTGTLTRNEMTVREVVTAKSRYQVTGVGYSPNGQFLRAAERTAGGEAQSQARGTQSQARGTSQLPPEGVGVDPESDPDLVQVLTVAARCNNATVAPRGNGGDGWQVIGDPTEGALIVVALKARIAIGGEPNQHAIFEIPFDSERKMMSVVVRGPEGPTVMHTKGAPEVLLARCTHEQVAGRIEVLSEARRVEILRSGAEMASRALRVLAFAYRTCEPPFPETELTFAGLMGMIDPPREEVKDAVLKCRTAGIRPVMITGDHPATALAIAQELHLAADQERVVTGSELDAISDQELAAQVDKIAVYARVSAEHKLRVVRAWKDRGHIVAMTGDGVNDAPAVNAADIGIAMGITGTDVTREASDMVLTDDNFTSIINAVEEGRGIFANIQKSVHYLLSCNAGEVLLMFWAALVGWPVPLMAIQILWINLVTDGLPALALGMEPPERDIMTRPPHSPHESVITWQRGLLMLAHGSLVAGVAAMGFWIIYQGDVTHVPRARTVAFCVVAFSQLFLAIACRSERFSMPELGLLTNPHLLAAIIVSGLLQLSVVTLPFAQPIFEVATHLRHEWLLVLGLSLAPVTVVEVAKLVRSWWKRA